MLNEIFLKDDYFVRGSRIDELREKINEMEQVTSTEKALLSNMTVYSVDSSNDDSIDFYKLTPGNMYVEIPTANGKSLKTFKTASLKKDKILAKGNFNEIIGETEKSYQPLMEIDGDLHFTSNNIWRTLSARISFSGDFVVENCLERDMGLARRFGDTGKVVTLTVREINGVKKIFSFLSDKYTYIPQTILTDIITSLESENTFGKIECLFWTMDHYITEVYLLFLEKAKEFKDLYCMPDDFIPGIYLATGGTGDCSLKVRGIWKKGNSIITQGEVAQRHFGQIKMDELMKDVEEKIFDEYAKLPEVLCKLMGTDISDNEWDSLSSTDFEKKNRIRISSVLQDAFKKLDFVGAITKNREKQLREQMILEFNMSEHYTAFDLAMKIMELPERINGLGKVYEEPFAKACCKAAYLDYEALI